MRSLSFCLVVFMVLAQGIFAKVYLTIYNDNLALVKDTRMLLIQDGVFDLSFTDVASNIDPTSVHFRCINKPNGVRILEQNYEYDLVSTERLLNKYTDSDISVTTKNEKLTTGRLLSYTGGSVLIRTETGFLHSELIRL